MMTRSRPIIPRNNLSPPASGGTSWRGVWAAAQVTPVLFSSYVWLIIGTLQPLLTVALLAAAVVLIAVRNTTFGLWWRYGASRLDGSQRDRVASAIVQVASLRGRRQPCLWVGRRMPAALVALPSESDLVVSSRVVDWVVRGSYSDVQISSVVAHGAGQQAVTRSRMVAAGEAFTLPWSLLVMLAAPVVGRLRTFSLIRGAWTVRWVVFAVAVWQSYSEGRWVGMWGVLVIATLSWSTGFLQRRWSRRLELLGDQRVISEGLGPVLAAMIRHSASLTPRRIDRLQGVSS